MMSEIPTTTFCLTCLSTTRNLYPIEDAKFFACITLLKLTDPSKFTLCWECNSSVRKAKLFRQKALQAHVLLNESNVTPSEFFEMTSLVQRNLNHIISIIPPTPIVQKQMNWYPAVPDGRKDKEEDLEEEIIVKDEPEVEDNRRDLDENDPLATCKSETDSGDETYTQKEPSNSIQTKQNLVIELIPLPPGPVPRNLKQVAVPPSSKIVPCITKPPRIIKCVAKPKPVTVEKIDLTPSSDLEYVDVQSKYTVRALTEERRLEVRKKRLKEASEDGSRHFCEKCAEFFKNKISLVEHIKKHETYVTGEFECNVCGMRFEQEELLRIHNNTHYRIINCNACPEEFSTYHKFVYHYKMCHDRTPISCKTCGRTFTNGILCQNHMRRHNQKRRECPTCHKMVRTTDFKAHTARHQPQPTLTCDECGWQCRGKVGLYNHKRNDHVPLKEGEAYCAECNIQFKTKMSYQAHLKQNNKHVNDVTKCEKCDREFTCLSYLRAHMYNVHAERGYYCALCEQSFSSRIALRRHERKVHPRAPRDNVCDICGQGFKDGTILRQHRNNHFNTRPHTCRHCGDSFCYSSALWTHVRLKHNKEKRAIEKIEERE